MTVARRWIEGASHWLARLSVALIVGLSVLFIAALLLQVLFRYALNAPLTWTEELATLLFVWAVLLAAATAVRNSESLRLTFVEDALPEKPAQMLRRIQSLLTIGFGGFLIYDGWRLSRLVWSNTSAAIGYPSWVLYISVPVAGGLLVLHSVARLLDPDAGSVEQERAA